MSATGAVILASLSFVAGWAIGRFDLVRRGRRSERRSGAGGASFETAALRPPQDEDRGGVGRTARPPQDEEGVTAALRPPQDEDRGGVGRAAEGRA